MLDKAPQSHDRILTINYLSFVYRSLVNKGYSPHALLANTSLSREALLDSSFRCSFDQHRQFIKNALHQTQDPNLGACMALEFNPLNIGLPASIALSSDYVSAALDSLKKYVSLNFSIVRFDFKSVDGDLVLYWDPIVDIGDMEYFVMSSALVISERFLRLLIDDDRYQMRGELTCQKPPKWDRLESRLQFSVRFGASCNRLLLPKDVLDAPLTGSDPVLHDQLKTLCDQHLLNQSGKASKVTHDPFVDLLNQLIVDHFLESLDIQWVANKLNKSPRTIRRRLEASGTSYSAILSQHRLDRAKQLLLTSDLTVTQIGHECGYSDSSNFARFFKSSTGQSPQEFRKSR